MSGNGVSNGWIQFSQNLAACFQSWQSVCYLLLSPLWPRGGSRPLRSLQARPIPQQHTPVNAHRGQQATANTSCARSGVHFGAFHLFCTDFPPYPKPVCKLKQNPRAWIKACYLTTLKQLCNALLQHHNFIPFLFSPQHTGEWWIHKNSFPSTSPCLICPNSSPDRSASSPSSPVTCPCSLPPNILSPHLLGLQKANESEGSACGPGTGGSWADQLTPAGSPLVWMPKPWHNAHLCKAAPHTAP